MRQGEGKRWDCSGMGMPNDNFSHNKYDTLRKVYSSQLKIVPVLSTNTTTFQCNVKDSPLSGLDFWFCVLVISKAWHYKIIS